MQTYITVLRGINVSGQKLIKMDALRSALETLGLNKVTTYIQSGNIVFQKDESNCASLESMIHSVIADKFGFDVKVLVLTKEYLHSIADNNPFVNDRNEDIAFLHTTFLSEQPSDVLFEKLRTVDYGTGEFLLGDKAVYLFCTKGYGNTKLSNTFFESKLKVTATTRNWRTVNELLGIAKNI
ncbi:MAG: DUF1697 domain-containing protein [Ignavibacteriae bacterium]|nr:DUF1697 domain-containing protein [Ignavibacteriota bacterium]